MKSSNYRHALTSAIAWMACIFPAQAQDKPAQEVLYRLQVTTPFGSRGAVIALLCESAKSQIASPGRHIEMICFQLSEVGTEPTFVDAELSEDDQFPVGSSRFDRYILGVCLTRKDEPVIITTTGLEYDVEVPAPWGDGTKQMLKNFAASGIQAPRGNVVLKVTGTLSDRDIRIIIREWNHDIQDRAFYFKLDTRPNHWLWAGVGDKPNDALRARAELPAIMPDSEPDDRRMRVTLVAQQKVGPSAYLLTIMAESPLANAPGRQKAFYYFLQNPAKSNGLQYVTNLTSKDLKEIGSAPGSEPGANPVGKLSGSMSTPNAQLSLGIGSNTLHYRYDYSSKKWTDD